MATKETQVPGEAAAIIAAVERLAMAERITDEQHPRLHLAVIPDGKKVEDLQPYLDRLLDAPRRIQTTARATTIASLSDYLNRFKLPDSALFASDDPDEPSLLGVIDFHGGTAEGSGGGDATPGSNATPRFGAHCVRYDFPISAQIEAWAKISGEPLGHAEMASFLDDRHFDIANPPLDWMQVDGETVKLLLHLMNIHDDQGQIDDEQPDDEPTDEDDDRYVPRSALYKLRRIRFGSAERLIRLARTVEIAADSRAKEGYNPKTGERIVEFAEEHQAHDKQGRRVTVPDAFLLRVPIWEGETPQLVPVRLQYRLVRGRVAWVFTLIEWQRVIRFAVRTEAERVRQATELPLFYGARSYP